MANLFKNYTASCTDATETTVYTVPAATTSVMTILGVAILLSPVLLRAWRDFKEKK